VGKTTRITIDLTPELNERLEKLANTMGASKSDTVRDALRVLEYLVERNEAGYELLERKEGVTTPAGVFVAPGQHLRLVPPPTK
jgi:predicted transcriptional regulator